MAKFSVSIGDAKYEVNAPDENTAWTWANHHHNAMPSFADAKAETAVPERSLVDRWKQGMKDQAGVFLRDIPAGSARSMAGIGSNIGYLAEKAKNLFTGPSLSDLVTGETPESRNTSRKAAVDKRLADVGVDTGSTAYAAGKLGTDIAATLPVGGALAKGAELAAPALARIAPGLTEAIRTGGMSTGIQRAPGAVNFLRDMATRSAGGAVTGGASMAVVDPENAATGAKIGAALPAAATALGGAGNYLGGIIRGPQQSADMAAAVTAARNNGYVIPPTQANPSLFNRVIEGVSGKITTAQNASARNTEVTNTLAAKAIGLNPGTKITPDVLDSVRNTAGQAYEAVKNTGFISPGSSYAKELDSIAAPYLQAAKGFPNAKPSPVIELVDSLRSPNFDASAAVEKMKQLRRLADDSFRTGNTDVARAAKDASSALEDVIEAHVMKLGNTALLDSLRESRKLIAKTYSVEKALNPTTGTVDARKLGSQLKARKPLSGELKEAADFANRFPKAAQPIEGMGSLPQLSPLDWSASAIAAGASGNPLMMLGVGARPAVRALTLSPMVQNNLIQGGGNTMQNLLSNREVMSLGARAAPALAANR